MECWRFFNVTRCNITVILTWKYRSTSNINDSNWINSIFFKICPNNTKATIADSWCLNVWCMFNTIIINKSPSNFNVVKQRLNGINFSWNKKQNKSVRGVVKIDKQQGHFGEAKLWATFQRFWQPAPSNWKWW